MYTGVAIHAESFALELHKLTIINHSIHRPMLHLTLDKPSILQETGYIKIAQRNGLNIQVNQMIRKKRLRLLLAENSERN